MKVYNPGDAIMRRVNRGFGGDDDIMLVSYGGFQAERMAWY